MRVKGIYTPVVTPFAQQNIDVPAFEANIEKMNASGLAGYVLFGSTGEAVHLNDEEKITLLHAARKVAKPNMKILVGTGKEGTRETIAFTRLAADNGAEYALVLTPHYYEKERSGEMMQAHFTAVADAAPIPVVLYNVPRFTGMDLSKEVILKLAQHPNIVGIKDSSNSLAKIVSVVQQTPDDFSVLLGNASLLLAGLAMGADGAILALCTIAFARIVEIYRCFSQNEDRAAKEKFVSLLPVLENVLGDFGIPGIKVALDQMGFHGGEPRQPLLPLSPAEREKVRHTLQEAHLLSPNTEGFAHD